MEIANVWQSVPDAMLILPLSSQLFALDTTSVWHAGGGDGDGNSSPHGHRRARLAAPDARPHWKASVRPGLWYQQLPFWMAGQAHPLREHCWYEVHVKSTPGMRLRSSMHAAELPRVAPSTQERPTAAQAPVHDCNDPDATQW